MERAHRSGLRVSAHIETAADFDLAVRSGVDVIAHLPASWQIGQPTGYPSGDLSPWLISEAGARRAAESGTLVITTTSPPPGKEGEEAFARVHRHNLEVLRRHGVRLALGSDKFAGTVLDEVDFLARLGVFTPAELLRLLAVETPQAIFPDRKIGRLGEGDEADFLVLEGDPRTDVRHLRTIRLRVKGGWVLLAP